MDRKIHSTEGFLRAAKEETVFRCFPFFANEFYQNWNSDWEKYLLKKYNEALIPNEELLNETIYEDDTYSPSCYPWQIVAGDTAFDFLVIILKEYCESERLSFEMFYHQVFYAVRNSTDFEYTYGFWCSEKWQKMLRETYDIYGARCNTYKDWISLIGETVLLFTYES